MNGLVQYDSSDSEDDAPKEIIQRAAKPTEPSAASKIVSLGSSTSLLGGSLLVSEYQLRMLSRQKSKAAKAGSKKRIFITAPNLEDLEDDTEEKVVKKSKTTASSIRSKLFANLPKPSTSSNTMGSKVTLNIDPSTSATIPLAESSRTKSRMLMPNSVKKRIEQKPIPKPAPKVEVSRTAEVASDSDESDTEGGEFFNFDSKEKVAEELKRTVMEAGPLRPSRDMLRVEREKYMAGPSSSGLSTNPEVQYETTRHPEEAEEDDAIAPYGQDLASYHAIAGPIRRHSIVQEDDGSQMMERDAIRSMQGKRREDIEFVDAKVDTSLGNIRENIRKGANQKHVSTSIVDPLKEMKKNDPNAHVSKRTHQLKYLVELAKANESRLNQLWSNAKSSSRTTAQKYGW